MLPLPGPGVLIQLVVWPQDCNCDRKWLLEKVEGAAGLVVMFTDKVNTKNTRPTNHDQHWIVYHTENRWMKSF